MPFDHDSYSLSHRDAAVVVRPWANHNEPLPIVSARDCVVVDEQGKEFIDFTAGYFVNNAGHSHPRIIAAATDQLGKVSQVSGKHTTPPVVALAETLVALTPSSISRAFFTTGGSETAEFGLKAARQYDGRTEIACVDNAYHGLTLGALSACASEKYRKTAGIPVEQHTYTVPAPYCYRCPFRDRCEAQCLDDVEATFAAKQDTTAALIAEAIQSVGGLRPPTVWWERLDGLRRKFGFLLILDEIQTGLGRTGKMFAAEHFGLEPEILLTAKGLSGGVGSIGCMLVSDGVAERFYAGTSPTSAGNAISAAAGLAMIEVLIDEDLVANSARMGHYLTESVAALDDPFVGDIRFSGLLGGVELVADRDTQEPLSSELMGVIRDALFDDGMLLTVSGPLRNTLRLQPPLSVQKHHIDAFITALRRAFEVARQTATPDLRSAGK